jgi:3-hydroxyisobutyrate dehydrogenase-like beta-hydroxyacid dehydrogenase
MGTSIGFIGLGNLGQAISMNLAERSRLDLVFNRTTQKTAPFAEKGIRIASSITDLARSCDIVISLVSDDQALASFTEGEMGLAASLKRDGIHLSMSTILPATADSLSALHRQFNNHYIACPVMGRPEAARARKLNFCLAGDESVKQQLQPLLADAGAVNIWDYGAVPSNANTAKLCCNFLIVAAIESMAEAMALAGRSHIDKGAVMNMLTQTLFNCPVYTNYGQAIVAEKFLPAGFSLRMGHKDVRLINEQAERTGLTLPFALALRERMENSVRAGLGDHDWTAIALDIEKQTHARNGK